MLKLNRYSPPECSTGGILNVVVVVLLGLNGTLQLAWYTVSPVLALVIDALMVTLNPEPQTTDEHLYVVTVTFAPQYPLCGT